MLVVINTLMPNLSGGVKNSRGDVALVLKRVMPYCPHYLCMIFQTFIYLSIHLLPDGWMDKRTYGKSCIYGENNKALTPLRPVPKNPKSLCRVCIAKNATKVKQLWKYVFFLKAKGNHNLKTLVFLRNNKMMRFTCTFVFRTNMLQ